MRTAASWMKATKGGTELVLLCCDRAELLQLVEEAPDVIALAVARLLPADLLFPVGTLAADGPS